MDIEDWDAGINDADVVLLTMTDDGVPGKELSEAMAEEAAGIAELRSKLAAVDAEWAARGGAYHLVLESASMPESGERAVAVTGQASVSGLEFNQREGAVPTNVELCVYDVPTVLNVLQKWDGRWFQVVRTEDPGRRRRGDIYLG